MNANPGLDLSLLTPPPQPIPITILTGFLGSGKTTLLNRLLNANHGLKMAVLVNDFGDINIDSQLIVDVEGEDIISLMNGCVCCTIRGDLLDSVLNLLARPEVYEHIVIEASGVSYPAEIARTFTLPALAPFLKVDSILAMVDTEQVLNLTGEPAVLAAEQVSMADIVALNKIDLVEETQLMAVRQWATKIVPLARILETTHGNIPLAFALGTGAFDPQRLATPDQEVHVHAPGEADHSHGEHAMAFYSWSFSSDQPLAFTAVKEVIKTLSPNIIRAKGILALAEAPDRQGIFQLAGTRANLHLGAVWGGRQPHTQVVFISTDPDVDTEDLRLRFESCQIEYLAGEALMSMAEIEDWIRRQ